MKRHWTVRREFRPYPDGEQRWDRAYQYLLQWAMAREQETTLATMHSSQPQQEVDHADSRLCAGVHSPSN
jgi:hypothetical protein